MIIRRVTADEFEMLSELALTTFRDAFEGHPKNAPADMKTYMDAAFDPATLCAELEDPASLFLLCEIDGEPCGYAKLLFGNVEEPITGDSPVELCRLYSVTDKIGKGIGQALMDECLRIAKDRGCDVMWLGVWEFNPRAERFYSKQGFEIVGKHVFQLGSDPQTDNLMCLRLS